MTSRTPQKNSPVSKKGSLTSQRTQAKIGMAISMGTLVGTGFMAHMFEKDRAGIAHMTHIVAGVALVGFSYWHWKLYQRSYPAGTPSGSRLGASSSASGKALGQG